MKKLILIFTFILGVIFIFSTTSVFAQYAYFGLKAGVNMASWRGDDADPEVFWGTDSEKKPRISIVVGGYSTIVLAKVFAIQPELLFTMQGVKYEYEVSPLFDNITLKLAYIQLPVLLKFYIPMPGPVKINLFAGPQVSYNVIDKWEYEWDYGLGEDTDDGDIDEDYTWSGESIETKKLDYGVVFGAGSDFIVKSIQITVEARYTLGFAQIFETTSGEEIDIKNGTFSIMAGVGF